jgi:hypothetical protein
LWISGEKVDGMSNSSTRCDGKADRKCKCDPVASPKFAKCWGCVMCLEFGATTGHSGNIRNRTKQAQPPEITNLLYSSQTLLGPFGSETRLPISPLKFALFQCRVTSVGVLFINEFTIPPAS